MIAPMLVGLSSIGVAFASYRCKARPIRITLCFIPIFVFLALRYDYGNDYSAYLLMFEKIASQNIMTYGADDWRVEIGWLALNRLFSSIGFFPMVAVLALANCYVYARFIRKFVPVQYYWLAIFLYVFHPDNMLTLASAMRQNVSITLFLLAIEYILSRNFVKYSICVALAGAFHTSAFILIPIYFFCSNKLSIKKELAPIFVCVYVVFFVIADRLLTLFFDFSSLIGLTVFDRYLEYYSDEGVFSSGLGLIFYGVNLALLLWMHNNQNKDGRLIYKLAIVGIFLIPFAGSLMMISRISFYFKVVMIAAVPLIARDIKSFEVRLLFIGTHLFFTLFLFYNFFQSPVWKDFFDRYNTIFSAL